MSPSARKAIATVILAAISIFLGITRLGFIPVPNVAGDATIMHVPAILGGVLQGPVVGILVGAFFGLFSLLNAGNPIFADPLVSIVPRLFIGLAAYLAFACFKRVSLYLAWIAAGLFGTLTNTILVLSLAIFRGYITPDVVVTIIPQAIAEMVIAIVLTIAIARGIELYQSGKDSWYAGRDDGDILDREYDNKMQ
ncbi:ECF transporter S component [Pelotomaculum propionicicum]|uniref:ECF transporter S component n=1 Tax=Pelotomaculum propionicicum TaxID=258475 RepID=UPI003B799019